MRISVPCTYITYNQIRLQTGLSILLKPEEPCTARQAKSLCIWSCYTIRISITQCRYLTSLWHPYSKVTHDQKEHSVLASCASFSFVRGLIEPDILHGSFKDNPDDTTANSQGTGILIEQSHVLSRSPCMLISLLPSHDKDAFQCCTTRYPVSTSSL